MDPVFRPAMLTIYGGLSEELARLLEVDPTLATRRSSCSHPTLLQMVAVEAGLGRVPDAVEAARLLVAAGSELQEPLVAAASTDARDLVWFLLECGASASVGRWKPLDEALYWSHTELAEELVAYGAPVDSLRVAAGMGDVQALASFFDAGDLLPAAGPVGSPFADTVPLEFANDPAHLLGNALVTAILNNRQAAAEWLISHGAAVNFKPCGFHWGGAALHAAVWRDDLETVDWLLAAGADPALEDDAYGANALGWAEHNGHTKLAAKLAALL